MKITTYEATKLTTLHMVTEDLENHLDLIKERMLTIIDVEAPISLGLLERRTIQSLGMKKIGRIIQELLDSFVPTLYLKYTTYNKNKFVWRNEDVPASCGLIRKTGTGANRRDAKDVPIEEAINAIKYVKENTSLETKDEIVREAARLMGYTRLGSVVKPLFEDAYKRA